MKNRGTISIKEVHTAEELKQAQKIREEEFDIVGKSHVEVFYWAMFTR